MRRLRIAVAAPMRKIYAGNGITVSYDARICIHVARCVRELPEVFDPQARPWIRPERAEAGAVAEVVRRCPTGALLYELTAGPPEQPDPEVTVTIEKNGPPLYVRGAARLEDAKGDSWEMGPRFALCRCGGSGNKPFCDGTHRTMGFQG
jgi:uncharacterized Fe-S cluster protein YjdI/CDGSH-type Zn-finger protein